MPGLDGYYFCVDFIWSSFFECRIAGHIFHKVKSRRFELFTNKAKSKQKYSEVVFCTAGIEGSLLAGCRSAIDCLGSDGQTKLDVGFYLSCVKCRFKPAEFYGSAIPDIVKINSVVATVVVTLGLVIGKAVPEPVQVLLGAWALFDNFLDEVVADRLGVAVQSSFTDTERVKDQRFLLVDQLGEVAQRLPIEWCRIDVDVYPALIIHFGSAFSNGANNLLQVFDVCIAQNRCHHFRSQMRRGVAQ